MTLADEVWARQSMWSRAATKIKKSIAVWRTVLLALTIAAALFATLSAAVASSSKWLATAFAIVSAICVGLLPVFRPRATGKVLQEWTGARSVSEALKSEIYLYLARSGDYQGPERENALATARDKIEDVSAGLLPHLIGLDPVSRPLPEVDDPRTYFDVRVTGQIDGYFKTQTERLRATLRRFKAVEVTLTLGAVLLGVLAATFAEAGLAPWVAVITTVTAAIAARSAAGNYDFQLVEYLRTANELRRLRSAANRTTDPAELDKLVRRSEQIMSNQNEAWLAKLSTDAEVEPDP